MLIKIIIM